MKLGTHIVPAEDRFDIFAPETNGLSLRLRGGMILNAVGSFIHVAGATVTLTASAENFIEADDSGSITANTSGFTAGRAALYVVETNATRVVGIEDWRGQARQSADQALTASGAILDDVEFVTLNNSGAVIAATIAAPRAGRFLVISQVDAGTQGHTVTLTAGTYNGTNNVATFNAAGETLVLYGVTATRFVIVENIGAVALS